MSDLTPELKKRLRIEEIKEVRVEEKIKIKKERKKKNIEKVEERDFILYCFDCVSKAVWNLLNEKSK